MSDDKTRKGPQDRSRVNVNEDYELRYWTGRFGVSEQELRDAVQHAGTSVAAVERQLKKKSVT